MHSRLGRAASLATSLLFAILLAAVNFKANQQTLRSPEASSSSPSSPSPLSPSNHHISERLHRLGPLQVLEQYMKFHGAESLMKQQNFTTSDRQFAVAYLFPCAARAGNQFHNFFNNLLWAIITNRTLLIRFDSPTRQLCRDQPRLNLAPWMPLWDDWADAFLLSEDDVISVPIDPHRQVWDRAHVAVLFPQIPDILYGNQTLFRGRWIDHPINNVFGLTYVKDMGDAQRTLTHKLYRNGADFLLGMLYRYCFLPEDIAQTHGANAEVPRFSLALHSRHTVVGDTGEFVHEEIDCLRDLLPENRSLSTCSVCIMSDRTLTIRLLSEWLLKNNCTPVISDSQQQSNSLSMTHGGGGIAEHGDRPATGFLQDLELCSRARSGIIGDSHRSSFLLLKELIEFERQTSGDSGNALKELLHCELTQREPSGYNYGPDTPMFQHWSKLQPFVPIKTLQQYRNLHGVEAIIHQPEKRQYTVAFFPFDSCSIAANGTDQMYPFFNQLIWSVISNRTLLWLKSDGDKGRFQNSDEIACKEALKLASWIPSYDTFYARLGLPRPDDVSTSASFGTSSHAHNSVVRVIDAWSSSVAADANSKIMLPPSQSSKISITELKTIFGKQFLPELAKKLYRKGCNFLYGMLFDETIEFADSLRHSNPPDSKPHPDAFSVAFDAWYDHASCNNTLHETKCFDMVLSTVKKIENKTCNVYLLTNSESTLANAQRWLSDRTCTIWMKSSTSGDVKTEFLQNFILGSNARTAFIGPRSSLLLARIEYLRQQEIWRKGRNPPLIPELLTCFTNFS